MVAELFALIRLLLLNSLDRDIGSLFNLMFLLGIIAGLLVAMLRWGSGDGDGA